MNEQTNPQKFETFDLTFENNVARICLNRPEKRNSMIPSFWEDLPKVVRDIDSNSLARVIVLLQRSGIYRWHGSQCICAERQYECRRSEAGAHSPWRRIL